jgi:hypothetical protein
MNATRSSSDQSMLHLEAAFAASSSGLLERHAAPATTDVEELLAETIAALVADVAGGRRFDTPAAAGRALRDRFRRRLARNAARGSDPVVPRLTLLGQDPAETAGQRLALTEVLDIAGGDTLERAQAILADPGSTLRGAYVTGRLARYAIAA